MTADAHLLLVRAAESTGSDGRPGTRDDPGLSVAGRRQAAGLALRLRVVGAEHDGITRLLSSPATRAVQTMVPVADQLGRTPATDAGWSPAPPDGETAEDFAERIADALEVALGGSGTTVVVTHAAAIRQAIALSLDVPLATTARIVVPHARIAVLSRTEDVVTLSRLGA